MTRGPIKPKTWPVEPATIEPVEPATIEKEIRRFRPQLAEKKRAETVEIGDYGR